MYGSIPHLIGSRVGKTDKYLTAGQCRIATERVRDKHDIVIVQEKLDGSCVSCLRHKDELMALTRSGKPCRNSPYPHHRDFARWVRENQDRFELEDGERIVGEWLGTPHGTLYDFDGREPFVSFDIMTGSKRVPYDEFICRSNFATPPLISWGPPRSIEWVKKECPTSRYGGEHIEGWIWRVERHGSIDFVCKYVQDWYRPGLYL